MIAVLRRGIVNAVFLLERLEKDDVLRPNCDHFRVFGKVVAKLEVII